MAKVLSERLKVVLTSTIAANQSAFVRGRQILDPILIANEVLDYWKTNKQKGIIIKLDVEKAFDKLNWDFLLSLLRQKAFNSIWIEWIRACIIIVSYSILLNAKPRGYIKASRGIRPGDPLSPFLFIIAMDYLSMILEEARSKNPISGCHINRNHFDLNYLLFANDILLFSTADIGKIQNLRIIISSFKKASGLKISQRYLEFHSAGERNLGLFHLGSPFFLHWHAPWWQSENCSFLVSYH